MLVVSILVALLAAFLPVSNAFAATEDDQLERDWANKLSMVKMENLFYSQVRLLPTDFEDKDDMARAYELFGNYSLALKGANAVVLEHAGFDKRGHVTNEIQAVESLEELAAYLHIMRGALLKIDEEGYKLRRIK
jgi:hypothetical protein